MMLGVSHVLVPSAPGADQHGPRLLQPRDRGRVRRLDAVVAVQGGQEREVVRVAAGRRAPVDGGRRQALRPQRVSHQVEAHRGHP